MLSSNTSAVSGDTVYVEDVFSTWLYTGNGTSQTITNGIDLTGKGGMTWIKGRSSYANNYHTLTDTVRGAGKSLTSNDTSAEWVNSAILSSFSSTGFSVGGGDAVNLSAAPISSWTFRKQPKFFDVVTYTGTGSNRTIAHSLGSTPGCIIVKRTDTTGNWQVYHRSLTSAAYKVELNTTAAQASDSTIWNSTAPTSTVFSVGTSGAVNASGSTYVAYIFAHDAGGFGLTGTDNVISCGTFTTDGSGAATVSLGYEPQWLLLKDTTTTEPWWLVNNMSGFVSSPATTTKYLVPNQTDIEANWGSVMAPTSTGFIATGLAASQTYIYIAIRRGPMKVPTDGTKVFTPTLASFIGSVVTDTGYVVDMVINKTGTAVTGSNYVLDRLRGSDNSTAQQTIQTNTTSAEAASSGRVALTGTTTIQNGFLEQDVTANNIVWSFRRAPSFFDEVCYTGTGANTAITHNLGVTPELFIVKRRDTTSSWNTYVQAIGNTNYLAVETTAASTASATRWNNTSPTSTQFSLGTFAGVNASGGTYVAYLFATCAGVSKVGSYTGTGTTKQVDCGFAAGARFVLIKRTDSTGDWYVWDTARGIVSGNDPYLLLNSTAAEVTTTDYIDPYSAGFELSSTAPATLNASGGTYIFLAIA